MARDELLDKLAVVKLLERLLLFPPPPPRLIVLLVAAGWVEGSGAEMIAENTGCCSRRRAVGRCSGTRLKQASRNCLIEGLTDLG